MKKSFKSRIIVILAGRLLKNSYLFFIRKGADAKAETILLDFDAVAVAPDDHT